jgi:nucleoside-diphosphate-sugar epimerase
MTQALVDATADVLVEQLVVISTDAVYGSGSGVFSEQSACAPDSIYGAMALAREMICASVETPVQTIVRPVAVYGAGDTHNSYGPNRFARQALSSGEIGLLGAGEATRDHVTVQDVAEVIIRVVAGRQAGTVNVASGQSISFADLAVLVGSADGMSANVVSAGTELAPTFKTYDTSTLLRWFPDFMPTVAAMGVPRMVATMRESETG